MTNEIPLVSVVVPMYNEEDNIGVLLEKIEAVFATLPGYGYECLFVNDCSTDRTRTQLGRLAETHSHLKPVHLMTNSGQSAALMAGLHHAEGEYILTLDGDLQNDPADFPEFLHQLQEYDCVFGYRANRKDTLLKRISSRVANYVRNLILHDGVRDSGCGSKGFRRHCIEHLVLFNGMHRFLAVFMRMAGCSIIEIPVKHHPRIHGTSKYGLNNRLWRGLYDLIGVGWLRRRMIKLQVESGKH